MAEEPQPSTITSGADAPDVIPANAEDRKAAQALSSLDSKGDDNAAPKKEVDLKALGEAMKNLDFTQKNSKSNKSTTTTTSSSAAKKDKDEAAKPVVKVNPADVTLLVEQLDLSKTKATELLRAHDADAVKAMTAWVQAAV